MALKPGWYPQDDGQSRYWDGDEWLDGPPTAVTDHEPSPAEPAKKSEPVGKGALLGGLVVLLLLGWGFASCGGNDSPSKPDEFDTQATCKDIVRKQLKNPSTADFSAEQQNTAGASGQVVAENALGGKVTYSYRCTLSGSTVQLEDLSAR